MEQYTYFLSFEGVSPSDSSFYADELRQLLLEVSPDITVQRRRANPLAQDLGGTLVLILGTPAVVATATAIGNWLQKRTSASLTIETGNKKVVAQNLSSKDAARLIHLFLEKDDNGIP